MAHTQAFADDEWRGVEPWNPPTFATLAPGATKTYGVKFLLSGEIRQIEATLAANNRPVAIGIPGYILPMDIDGRLLLKHNQNVKHIAVDPEDALDVRRDRFVSDKWKAWTVRGKRWLAAAMKEFGQPRKEEIRKFEQFIDGVLWGGLQYKDGPNKYGVRKSLFYYSPPDLPGYKYDPALDWTTWTSWKKTDAESIGRGYNYPHVVAAYWAMYRLARNHNGLVTNHAWNWYLDQAYETIKFMFSRNPNGRRRVGYVELGLMEGDIILSVLEDLKREGWNEKAVVVEELMKERTERWKQEAFPFGSEMAWDSTGQEEVYAWCRFFGYDDKALVSLNSIIGYMPTLPHWGYNGNARRYWDFLYD